MVARYADKGEISVTNTCPTQLHAKGRNSFKARAIFEHLNDQASTFAGPTGTTDLKATATLSNGTTWTKDYSVTIYPSKLEQETNAYAALNTLECLLGWHTLPSGKVVCIVGTAQEADSRKQICEEAGAFLMELTRRDDAQSFLYFMFKIASSSTEPVSVGAVVKTINEKNVWVWEKSGKEVDICQHGCIVKSNVELPEPAVGQSIYLDLVNSPTSSAEEYMAVHPYFDLHARSAPSTDATYFGCMKDGEGASATAPSLSVWQEPIASSMMLQDTAEMVYTLKVPHRTQFPFSLLLAPSSKLRVCKIKVTHIGRNFPCLMDPTNTMRDKQNTSSIWYQKFSRSRGADAKISFDMVSNWGKVVSLGSVHKSIHFQVLDQWTMIILLIPIQSKSQPISHQPLLVTALM